MGGVAVAGDVGGVGERVVLGLETDLDDLHGVHDEDGLSGTGTETGNEDGRAGKLASLVGEPRLVDLERGETDSHLGDDTGDDGTETLVETERGLTGDNLLSGSEETKGLGL